MAGAESRWTDNPFWQPETPEQKEWSDKVTEALRQYRESKEKYPDDESKWDDSMAIEIGLFPSREEVEDVAVSKAADLLVEVEQLQKK